VKPVRHERLMQTLATEWAKKQAARAGTRGAVEAPVAPVRPGLSANTGEFAPLDARILVVEDNAVNQKVALHQLLKLGVRADVASNGREAIEMLAARPYHLVLMDCQMPEMNGYEATAAIRHREGPNRDVPIVAMTADVVTSGLERSLKAGMNDFVSKPVELEDLARALRAWLRPDAAKSRELTRTALQ
jgi:CheY-like chemotaxis protein